VKTPHEFYQRSQVWLDQLLEADPVAATQLGEHRYDHTLGDMSLEAAEKQEERFDSVQAELAGFDTAAWPNDARIDHTLMTQIIKSFRRQLKVLRVHRRNPGQYLDATIGGILLLIMKEFAPLPNRLASALGRVKDVPAALSDARRNLIADETPRVWVDTAIEQAQMASMLYTAMLPQLAQQVAPDLADEFSSAGQAAGSAVEAYAAFLKDELLPNARGQFAVGKPLFEEILREDHMVDYGADELLEIGWVQFEETKRQMAAVARDIDPSKTVEEILEEAKADHPTADGLLKAYEDAMNSARRYVIDHEIATIPAGETLRVVETPLYMRPIIPYAAYMPPGILETKQDGIFVVTPVDPNAPVDLQEQKLKGHFSVKLPVVALHEAYPGHHLQMAWANRAETLPRKMGSFLATLFIEGWAFYCEELMEQLGWIAKPLQRLGRLHDQLWRAGRIILDVSLHTGAMTVDEAVDFLVDRVQLERTNAMAEVRRYAMTPTQPQSYLMGKLQILDLVAEYKKTYPEATLRQMHDAFLRAGSLPPRLMRQALFG